MNPIAEQQTSQNNQQIFQYAHAQESQQVLESLGSSPTEGLSPRDAEQRRRQYGANQLPEATKEHPIIRFLKHFHDVMIYVLLGSAVMTALLGEWIDTTVILLVVVINAVIGFVQEGRSEAALEGIKNMLSPTASVRREGSWQEVDAEDLVPGDIVRLSAGDKIPADIRLIEASDVSAEESALTGESVSAEKSVSATPNDAPLGDRSSMLFSGTSLSAGSAQGVVVGTGEHTQIGQINTMMSEVDTMQTPLTRQVGTFTKWLAIGVLAFSVILGFIDFFIYNTALVDSVMGAVGFAVAAIPEGLPALITITLALGVQMLAKKKAITRKLPAVQTLGSVTVICSDKTGTLTKNEMTVTRAVTGGRLYEIEGNGYEPKGAVRSKENTESADSPQLTRLAEIMGITNDTDIVQQEHGWGIVGEPTEGAVKSFSLKLDIDANEHTRTATLPFSSDYKFMATSVEELDLVLIKGAPDVLLDRSAQQLSASNDAEPLDRAYWEKTIGTLSDEGLRVLAAAYHPATPKDHQELTVDSVGKELVFVGVCGIVDPPRPEAIEAIEHCHRAGIQVKMITGDHAGTATAIAQQMGIDNGAGAITGKELEKATDAELATISERYQVFARTSPEHKLRLVKSLQSQGEIVSMTGDGVNDAPALRRADVGVAMGIKGTEVTKESAEVVLADDNFATIATAVKEGRRIYDNLRKALVFLLVTNGSQSLVMLTAILCGWMLPLSPLQILWVNMVTAVTLAFAYAFEPAEQNVMDRKPENPQHGILRAPHLVQIALASLLITAATMGSFYWFIHRGTPAPIAHTLATTVLVVCQIFYLFNAKSLDSTSLKPRVIFNNKVAWLVIAVLVVLQLTFIHVPVLQGLFGSAALPWRGYVVSVVLGLAVFLLLELAKPVIYAKSRREQRVAQN